MERFKQTEIGNFLMCLRDLGEITINLAMRTIDEAIIELPDL